VLRVAGAQGLCAFWAYCLASAIKCKRLGSLFTSPEKQGRPPLGQWLSVSRARPATVVRCFTEAVGRSDALIVPDQLVFYSSFMAQKERELTATMSR
jgi:hypothetical protein